MVDVIGWGAAMIVGLAWFLSWRHLTEQRDEAEEARRCVQAQVGELQESLEEVRSAARRRVRGAEDDARHAVRDLAGALLPVEDALARAAEAEGDLEATREGVRLVQRQMESALAKGGLTPVAPLVGDPFDPRTQSCVAEAPGEESGDLVVESVERRGWQLHERLLRPAEVIVARKLPRGEEAPPSFTQGAEGDDVSEEETRESPQPEEVIEQG